jgi:hypothetical protein
VPYGLKTNLPSKERDVLELKQLGLVSLASLKGGLIDRMLQQALNRMAMDLRAAPDIAEWRKVTLTIRAKPTIEDGELGDVITEFEVNGKVPPRITSARMEVKSAANGAKQLFFNLDAPDQPDQQTLFTSEEREVRNVS